MLFNQLYESRHPKKWVHMTELLKILDCVHVRLAEKKELFKVWSTERHQSDPNPSYTTTCFEAAMVDFVKNYFIATQMVLSEGPQVDQQEARR